MFHNKSRIWKLRPNMLHFPGELLAKVGFIRLAKLAATNNMIKLRNVPLKLNINLVYVNSITVQPWYKPYKIGLMRIASAPNLMQVDGKQLNNKICFKVLHPMFMLNIRMLMFYPCLKTSALKFNWFYNMILDFYSWVYFYDVKYIERFYRIDNFLSWSLQQ